MTAAPRVFVSYRRQEAAAAAAWLNEIVSTEFGQDAVYVDKASLRGGEKWWQSIQQAIERSTVMIVVIGQHWLRLADEHGRRLVDKDDDWVRNEICGAIESQLTIVPLLLAGATLPPKEALPPCLQAICDYQALELYEQNLGTLRKLLVERLLELGFVGKNAVTGAAGRIAAPDDGRRLMVFGLQINAMNSAGDLAARARAQARMLAAGNFSADSEALRQGESALVDFQADIQDLLFRERMILPQEVFALLHQMNYDLVDFLMHLRSRCEPTTCRPIATSKYIDVSDAYSGLTARFDELEKAIRSAMFSN